MSVQGSTRRERVRHPDGTTTDLPGGVEPLGLSAIARCAAVVPGVASPSALTGAARAAVLQDVVEPALAAAVLVGSSGDVPGVLDMTAGALEYTTVFRPTTAEEQEVQGRPDTALFGAFVLDRSRLDEPGAELIPDLDPPAPRYVQSVPLYAVPQSTATAPVLGAEAHPADDPWALAGPVTDENLFPWPSFSGSTAGAAVEVSGGVTRPLTGGVDAGPYLRCTASSGTLLVVTERFGTIRPGDVVSLRFAARLSSTGPVTATLRAFAYDDDGAPVLPAAVLGTVTVPGGTAAWTTFTLDGVAWPHDTAGALSIGWLGNSGIVAGNTLDLDQVKVRRSATAGAYVDGASSGGVWASDTSRSASYVMPALAGASYARPSDPNAPELGLPDQYVHERTGALVAGAGMGSPLSVVSYATPGGRRFTVAGWVAVLTSAVSTPPTLRWVLEVTQNQGTAQQAGDRAVHRLYGDPFVPGWSTLLGVGAQYVRAVSTFSWDGVPAQFLAPGSGWRAFLEVVTPPSADGPGTVLRLRGVHGYAGEDRGDDAGLRARAVVEVDAYLTPAAPLTVSRVDVHGNERLGHVTAATARCLIPTTPTATTVIASGASPGRLTIRMGAELAGVTEVLVQVEETDGYDGAVSIQNVRTWRELDATDDVEVLRVSRSADADPSDSSVPVGNYAASEVSLSLDDPEGRWSLFGRSYLDLGQRIEVATGVVYRNRVEDPAGVDAHATLSGESWTWPTPSSGPAVDVVAADVHGQVPPAPYAGTAAGGLPCRVNTPAVPGQSYRGRVWVRWDSDTAPVVTFGPSLVARAGLTHSVTAIGTQDPVAVPAAGSTWWLLELPDVVAPVGANAVTVTVTGAGRVWVAAPYVERAVDGDPVEVVETAPAGIFYATGWSDATGGEPVQVTGLDVLGWLGDRDYDEAVHLGSSLEQEIGQVARRFLGLGSDQVRVVESATPVGYVTPAQTVAGQVADLAKAAAVTVFTDGLGRVCALLRQNIAEEDTLSELTAGRGLVRAGTATTPDAVRNEVGVTVHPLEIADAVTEVGRAGRTSIPGFPYTWRRWSAQDIPCPAGETTTIVLAHEPAVDIVWTVSWLLDARTVGETIAAWTEGDVPGVATFDVEQLGASVLVHATVAPGAAGGGIHVTSIVGEGRLFEVADLTVRTTEAVSVAAFGRRPVDVDLRLGQSAGVGDSVAASVLDTWALRDATGERWLPDLDVDALYDPWREVGDRVLVDAAAVGDVAGEFRVVSHDLEVGAGGASAYFLRRVVTGQVLFVLDASELGGGHVLGY